MIALNPGQRLLPNQNVVSGPLNLVYQGDGNLVLYQAGVPVWATDTSGVPPGHVEMQGDGNLVIYDTNGTPYWATNTNGPGAALYMEPDGLSIEVVQPVILWEAPITPLPTPPGSVRLIEGRVEKLNRSFRDRSGPRYIHICSDFGAIKKSYENRDAYRGVLDTIAKYHQGLRAAYRLNGWLWTPSGLTLDPIRDSWWEDAVYNFGVDCHERGLKIDLSCMDMYNWSEQQAAESIDRLARIMRSISEDLVLVHEWNEMRGTWPNGEQDTDLMAHLAEVWHNTYPWSLCGGSDPGSQDKEGMIRLSPDPCNIGLIHNVRWEAKDATRRAFNAIKENYPDEGVQEGEPTGPEDPAPPGEYNRLVYQPIENHNDLLGIYTMHLISGQISTYFNDPALVSRRPLDETWGFKELVDWWKHIELPQNIGQGSLKHGGQGDAPFRFIDTNGGAERADSSSIDGQHFGVISGGNNWRVFAGVSGEFTAWRATDGMVVQRPISEGEQLPVNGPEQTLVRIR